MIRFVRRRIDAAFTPLSLVRRADVYCRHDCAALLLFAAAFRLYDSRAIHAAA